MLSKHECYYGRGMDALVTVCSRNTNVISIWFGHGCTGNLAHAAAAAGACVAPHTSGNARRQP